MWVLYTHISSKAGKHARDSPANSHVPTTIPLQLSDGGLIYSSRGELQ